MSRPALPAVVFRSAVLAGLLVGLVDGARAAWLGHLQWTSLLGCLALTLGFDIVAATAGGSAMALLLAVGSWGRRRGAGLMASGLGWLLAGGAAAVAAMAGVAFTAGRNNRFLAAGVVALA